MKNKSKTHRVWFFIQQAKDLGRDSIDFYHPVSQLGNQRYAKLVEELNEEGFVAKSMSNPHGNSLAGLIVVSNIQAV